MARDNRRRLRNYLLRPRLRFRYALGFFFLTSIGAGFVQLISYLTVSRVIQRILGEAGESAAALGPVVDTPFVLSCYARRGCCRSSASPR